MSASSSPRSDSVCPITLPWTSSTGARYGVARHETCSSMRTMIGCRQCRAQRREAARQAVGAVDHTSRSSLVFVPARHWVERGRRARNDKSSNAKWERDMSPDDASTATGEVETTGNGGSSSRRLLSGDGAWWWNGRRWVPATTEDGLWKWDGGRWKGTVDLEGKRPEDLATTLALLAEDRYAEAARSW